MAKDTVNKRSHRLAKIADSSRKRRWGRALLACCSIVAGMLAGEAFVRLGRLAPDIKPIELDAMESAYQRSSNPILSYELKPGYTNRDADSVTTYSKINAHGQRDRERTIQKPPGIRRLIVLGDSVVEGHGIERLEDLMTARLESLFGEPGWEVLNFGVSGYNTRAEVELLKEKALAFEPDLVLLVFVENDFDNFVREAFALPGRNQRPKIAGALFKASHLARLLFLEANLFNFQAELQPLEWHAQAMGDQNVVDGLKLFKTLSEQHSFEPYVAIWPRFREEGILDGPFLPQSPDVLAIEALCTHFGLPVFRLSSFFQRDLESRAGGQSPRALYSVGDEMHPSPHGCQIAAQGIYEVLTSSSPLLYCFNASRTHSFEEFSNVLEKLGGRSPDRSRLYYNQALHQERLGKREEARQSYESALNEDPRYVDAHINLAVLLATSRRLEEARDHLETALDIRNTSWGAWFNLGNVALSQEKIAEAAACYQKAVDLAPSEPNPYLALANVLESQKQPARALSVHRQCYKRFPREPGVLMAFGRFLMTLNQAEDARVLFNSVLKIDPEHQEARDALRRLND